MFLKTSPELDIRNLQLYLVEAPVLSGVSVGKGRQKLIKGRVPSVRIWEVGGVYTMKMLPSIESCIKHLLSNYVPGTGLVVRAVPKINKSLLGKICI